MSCRLLRALTGYGEKADIEAGCGGKTDGVSKVDRKYSSGRRRVGGRWREGGKEGGSESNEAQRQERAREKREAQGSTEQETQSQRDQEEEGGGEVRGE